MNKNIENVTILITYCKSCGFHNHYNELKSKLIEEFPNLKVNAKRANGISGEFEVYLNNELIHSKLNGQSFPLVEDIIKKINTFLVV